MLGACSEILGQKMLEQSFHDENIKALYINSDEVFEIHLSTSQNDHITVGTRIDGETFESSILKTRIDNNTLKIETGRTPDFEPFNDKLSAHKVLSIVLFISLPEGLDLDIFSTLASVDAQGRFGRVQINLGRGGCRLVDFRFRESATINTLSGAIHVEVDSAEVYAQSRKGNVVIPAGFSEGYPLVLKSIHGDIILTKSL
tara:strand:+ start:4324 stop:4926 length:603 start_codon:yes stop_codon:yes gene_type:complete